MNEELQIAAAEYVLGTLPADERARFAEQLAGDPALRDAVRWWQGRLSGLDAAVAPAAVPPNVWRNIENAVNRGQANHSPGQTVATGGTSNVVQLRRLAVWRGAALATGALAAGLAGFLVIDRLSVAPAVEGTGRYVAVVDTDGREPALVAEVDTRSGTIRIRSLAAEVPAGRSLELWHIPEGQGARSLGILEANDTGQTIADRIAAGPVNGIIAVTVEPEGGSPTGEATGPVVYSGRLVPIE